MSDSNHQDVATAEPAPRSTRRFVVALLVLFAVPGLVGFDLWPLTGWRMFSLSNRPCRERWVIQAVDGDDDVVFVDTEELPLAYRHAEWTVARLAGSSVPLDSDCPPPAPRDRDDPDGASAARRDEVCASLAQAVLDVYPDTVEVRLVRDVQRVAEGGGQTVITRDPEEFHACEV